MKRVIKFRAFHMETKTMHEVYSFCKEYIKNVKKGGTISKRYINEFKPIQQFTGLTDKNGVEIYDGDIVIYDRAIGDSTGQRIKTTHEIIFNNEVFAFSMKHKVRYIKLRKHWNYIYEVIGNIYENKELLNK